MHDPPPAIAFQKFSAWFWRRGVGRFLFVSHDARDRMAALVPLDADDVVIENGVSIAPLNLPRCRDDRFVRRFGWPAQTVVFGISGQIAPHKGHDDLIAALATAHASNPAIRLVIGGRGDGAYVAHLQDRIAALNLNDAVQFCGWQADAGDFYAGIDVLVLASRHEEGFGLVVAEAGERAVPAIVTRSGGVVGVVEEGVTALIVATQAPADMAAAMLTFAGDPAMRATMGRRARARVIAKFDIARQAAMFGDCLESIAPRVPRSAEAVAR